MKFCPYTLLSLLRQCGFVFERHGDYFTVYPGDRLTPEMKDALRRHKPELLLLIPERRG